MVILGVVGQQAKTRHNSYLIHRAMVVESPLSTTNREHLLQVAVAGIQYILCPAPIYPPGKEQRMRVPFFSSWTIFSYVALMSKDPYFRHTEAGTIKTQNITHHPSHIAEAIFKMSSIYQSQLSSIQ